MKLKPSIWCRIQEKLRNLKCPNCYTAKVKLCGGEEENAVSEVCGCTFEFNPDAVPRWQ